MWKRIVSIIILMYMIASVFLPFTSKAESSTFRTYDGDYVFILDSEVPLGITDKASMVYQAYLEINEYRAEEGMAELAWSSELADAAAIRAEEISEVWSHTRPNGSNWYTVNPSIMYGENLAKGYDTAEDVVQGWKDSPAHNENLLYEDFSYIGLAQYDYYVACEFCY